MTTGEPAHDHRSLTEAIEALIERYRDDDGPGAAILAAHNGEVLYRDAYGLASVELGVPIDPGMIFRLASITKQFTATAIMLLAQDGRLRLHDDITTLLPEYPTHGQRITVEHLMTHTSGIKSYTSMPEWFGLMRNDIALNDLIAVFKDEPLEFRPGERYAYNNSAYVLLGAIVERVSGQSYEAFLQEHIFTPLGMRHTMYDHAERVVRGRVAGYDRGPDGLANAAFLSMTHPHAAGALLSSVDDLLLWDEAMYAERLLGRDMLRRAHTSFTLDDGTPTGYGYGWAVFEHEGYAMVGHAGGINGFNTYALRLPEHHVFVAVLKNDTLGEPNPETLAVKIARLVLGDPYVEPEAIVLDPATLDRYVGVYDVRAGEERIVRRDGDALIIQHPGGMRETVRAAAPDTFFVPDSLVRVRFVSGDAGMVMETRSAGTVERATRADRPLPAERNAIELPVERLERYRGSYEIAPSLVAVVGGEGAELTIQMPGQPAFVILPASETLFFARDVDALIEFQKDERGDIEALVLTQGGQRHVAPKRS